MNNPVDLRTMQLLCSRICHDLIGPVSAVNTAVELMGDEEDGSLDTEALKVLARSAEEAGRKLTFFRAVFGQAGSRETPVQVGNLIELTNGVLASGKVTVQWDSEIPAMLPGGVGKVLMLLVFLAAETLPKGGNVGVRVQAFSDGLGVACTAEGDGATLRPEIGGVLSGGTPSDEVSARGIPAYVLMLLAEENDAKVEFSSSQPGQVTLAALLSSGLSVGESSHAGLE